GFAEFFALDPATGEQHRINTRNYLTPRQELMMAQDPQLIRSFAQHLSSELKRRGSTNSRIQVNAYASLNGRPSQQIIDPTANLTASSAQDWIVPLER